MTEQSNTSIRSSTAVASRGRILVVDDHPMNRKLCETLLEHGGFEVVTASDGAEGLALAREGGFDMVLMDLHMPVMDGFEATRCIRALQCAAGQVPVVAVTADSLDESRSAALAAGMNGLLSKPIQVGEFLNTVSSFLPPRG